MKTPVKAGDRVKFLRVFDLAPDPVYDMLGEVGTARKMDTVNTEKKSWNVWLVEFDDRNIWINESDLEIM